MTSNVPPKATGNDTKVFFDFLSQPSRSIIIFSRTCKLPIEEVPVSLSTGEHKTEEFKRKNPLAKVPVLQDGSEFLPESGAILAYLAGKYSVPEHWYPRSSLMAKARVDSALHWYHLGLRSSIVGLLVHRIYSEALYGQPGVPEIAAASQQSLMTNLKQLETYWLKDGAQHFMTGDEICVADVLCSCELEQLCSLVKEKHQVDMQTILEPYPAVRGWMKRVSETTAPHYNDAHEPVRSLSF